MGVEGPLVLRPTREATLELARSVGYSVEVLEPEFSDYTGCEDYRAGIRRAFVCGRGGELEASPFRFEV
jgi:hypothetical protein